MKKVRSLFAVAIIAAALSFGLPAMNFWGMVLIFLLTVLFALISVMITDESMSNYNWKDFLMCIYSAVFGMCIVGCMINVYDAPLWITTAIFAVILWIGPNKYMWPFAAWIAGCSVTFFIQSFLQNGFIWKVCVAEAYVVVFVISAILSFSVKKEAKIKKK